ncbi:hypothetical protein [Methylobacter sp.]|uniref:hypothetical protein n=1 Tax=Methylobacter sp. TaxID=2051955 RepID=UPI002488ECAE|nr:hypothetical protein [Methylobacter sp.]MDI1278159.1 hypothetical protein [Methylobacter sp.]MDI1358902.1 hypothetical protein [Methylobacter sp.]
MMLWLTENDLKSFFGEVVRNVAKELKIKEWDWRFNSELLEQIHTENQAVSKKLNEFFTAYRKWHECYVKVTVGKIEENLREEDICELQTQVLVRNSAREALLKELLK